MNIYRHRYLRPVWLVGIWILLNASLAITSANATTIEFTGSNGVIETDDGSITYSGVRVDDSFSGRVTY
jgi:hypothetical protein